jgi:hypothetical protein
MHILSKNTETLLVAQTKPATKIKMVLDVKNAAITTHIQNKHFLKILFISPPLSRRSLSKIDEGGLKI